jgi:alanine dehydrogenase
MAGSPTPEAFVSPTLVARHAQMCHYCVAKMPGAVARTSTFAPNNAILPFTLALAGKGWRKACADDPHLQAGMNIHAGKVLCRAVPSALGKPCTSIESVLA